MKQAAETPPGDLSRLVNRYSLEADLVCRTALHVGAGKASADVSAASDLPVVRDGGGAPYVPGSSFRGALRAGLESLLRGVGGPEEELRPWVCDPFSDESCSKRIQAAKEDLEPGEVTEARVFELAWERSCRICCLFGSTYLASRLWIADLHLAAGPATYVRNGVGLDRDLRTAAGSFLYDFEAVAAGSRFRLRLDLENAEDHEVGLVLTGLDLFGQGLLSVGGKRARGLGQASIEDPAVKFWQAADFFDPERLGGRDLEAADLSRLRRAARDYYVEGGHVQQAV